MADGKEIDTVSQHFNQAEAQVSSNQDETNKRTIAFIDEFLSGMDADDSLDDERLIRETLALSDEELYAELEKLDYTKEELEANHAKLMSFINAGKRDDGVVDGVVGNQNQQPVVFSKNDLK